MKSKHIYIGCKIPYEEVKNFIEPVEMTIPIPLIDFESIKGSNCQEFIKNFENLYKNLMQKMPVINSKMELYDLYRIGCISYTPHEEGYDFRFNPIDIYNNFFKYLGSNEKISFINLDKEDSMRFLKDEIKKTIEKLKKSIDNEYKLQALNELDSNKDYICKAYYFDLEDYLIKNNYILPKDVLFYLSYASLKLYEETKEGVYKIMPYEYYKEVSHMKTSDFPHMIRFDGQKKLWFNNFREDYERIITTKYFPMFNIYSLKSKQILCAWEILKPGCDDKEIKDFVEKVHNNSGKLNEIFRKLFEMKVNYFTNSGYKAMIKGCYGLDGYVGFAYDNDYITYDKFYNSERVPDERKTILSHPEAIYSIPSDSIRLTILDKQLLKDIMAKDHRIIKTNHTLSGSFMKKLDAIKNGPNVSTISFEKVIEEEKQKGKILILN